MESWCRQERLSDGTPEGTRQLHDLASGYLGASPKQLILSGSRLFFVADDGVSGRELWSLDPTAITVSP